MYSGSAIRGKVEWLDNTNLRVDDYAGIASEGGQVYRFKIDVLTKVKKAIGNEDVK